MTYLRFETRRTGTGLFAAMYRYRRDIHLIARGRRAEFLHLVDWLDEMTPLPPEEVYDAERRRDRLRTWWCPAAREHIRQSRRLCVILNESGATLAARHTEPPHHHLVWRDALQAVLRERRPRQPRPPRPRPRPDAWDRDRATIRRAH